MPLPSTTARLRLRHTTSASGHSRHANSPAPRRASPAETPLLLRNRAELLHQTHHVRDHPMFCDLPVPHGHHIDDLPRHLLARRRDAEEFPAVRARGSLARPDLVALGRYIVNGHLQVRE